MNVNHQERLMMPTQNYLDLAKLSLMVAPAMLLVHQKAAEIQLVLAQLLKNMI